jgi:hypothetical protein
MTNAYKILLGKPVKLERPSQSWKDIIKINLKEKERIWTRFIWLIIGNSCGLL